MRQVYVLSGKTPKTIRPGRLPGSAGERLSPECRRETKLKLRA